MTRKALALCLALVTVPAIGATTESSPPPSIDAYLSPKTIDKHGLNDTLWQLLNDAGQTVGFRGGKAQRAWELQQALNGQNDALNRLYTFAPPHQQTRLVTSGDRGIRISGPHYR